MFKDIYQSTQMPRFQRSSRLISMRLIW